MEVTSLQRPLSSKGLEWHNAGVVFLCVAMLAATYCVILSPRQLHIEDKMKTVSARVFKRTRLHGLEDVGRKSVPVKCQENLEAFSEVVQRY